MEIALGIALGLGLSAACGFRVFVPLLVISVAGRTGHLVLASEFEWLTTPFALIALSVATAAEITKLLQDRAWWQQCSDAMRARVQKYYNKADIFGQYHALYRDLAARGDAASHSVGRA